MKLLTSGLLSLSGWFFVGLSHLVHLLPRECQRNLGRFLGFLWFDAFRIRRKVVDDNLKLAFPDISSAERIRIGRRSLWAMGETLVEFLLMVRFKASQFERYLEVEGLKYLKEAEARGEGALLLSCHVGNGDFGCMAVAFKGYPVIVISKKFKAKWLNDAWFGLRRRYGTGFIAEERSSFEILRALKNKERVIFVLDQFMGPPAGVKTRFFGHETGTAQGLAVFQQRTGLPVIPTYSYRTAEGKLRVVIEEPIQFEEKSSKEETISFMTQKYTDRIEEIVRRHPEQWMWIHRRWKKFEVR